MSRLGEIWNDIYPYILQILLGAVALFALAKDWEDYVKKLGKVKTLLLFTATIAVICLTLFDTHSTRRETRKKEQIAENTEAGNKAQIDTLTQQIELERDENKTNSEGFRKSFDALYEKYTDLAARVQNADLLREIKRTQKDLKDTQSKLSQPKATLTASFWKKGLTLENMSRETTVSKGLDGSVTVDVIVLNTGDVTALNGSYTIRICTSCKFAKEPAGLSHLKGSADEDRQKEFEHILSKTGDEMRTLEIFPPEIAPPLQNRFEVDVIYSCVNCIFEKVPLWVNVQ